MSHDMQPRTSYTICQTNETVLCPIKTSKISKISDVTHSPIKSLITQSLQSLMIFMIFLTFAAWIYTTEQNRGSSPTLLNKITWIRLVL